MLRTLFLAWVLCLPGVAYGSAVKSVLPESELRGTAVFRFLGIPIYEARLYTTRGEALDWTREFGLQLVYRRSLSQRDLVESTLREMKRNGASLPVRDQLTKCFDDVHKGDSYLAVTDGPDRVMFWRNGRMMCALSYPSIKSHFMEIFLGENTRSRSFTCRLRGG